MPAPTNIDEFLELGVRSGLLEHGGVAAPIEPATTVADFAKQLVANGQLTRFQAEKLLNGRWRGFIIAGKYRLLERLGAGGMGAVYLCEHLTMGRRVALKVLPLTQAEDPASLKRFYREARAVARLDHPNIVRAFDLDHEENLHFLVLEFVDGSNLHDFVRRNGVLTPLRAAHYLRQAALGLAHAHEVGLVHRDIKPSNILLDRSGCVKILDMGLAQFFGEENSDFVREFENGFVIGTADYLAPEQAVSSQVDTRADLYSLGCTAYFLLVGRSPFQEGTSHQKMLWHQVRMPKPLAKHRDDVPEELAKIIDRMMAKEPARRFQTPTELAAALTPFATTSIPAPAVHEMPPLIFGASGLPSSHTSRVTEPLAQNGIATPGPRRIHPKSPTDE
jgi:serine/threonine protein kinase